MSIFANVNAEYDHDPLKMKQRVKAVELDLVCDPLPRSGRAGGRSRMPQFGPTKGALYGH